MTLNEQQRMRYLEAMGIDTFVPRWRLRGAPSSVQCLLPVADTPIAEQGAQSESPVVTKGAPTPATSRLRDSLVDVKSVIKPRSRSTSEKSVSRPVHSTRETESVAFSLAFWRVHPALLVVDSREPARALPTQTLLSSVLSAVGLPARLPRPEIQDWPLAGANAGGGWSEAREMIQAFLEPRLLSEPVHHLLVMGEPAARAVLDDAIDITSVLGQRVPVHAFACEALVAPSLAQLLLDPLRKRQLWALLAPLRGLNAVD